MTIMFYRRSILIITLVGIFSSQTAFASCQGGIAQDDPTFKYTSKAGVKQSCKNISGNPKRKKIMCRLPEVQSHCMLTCGGSCCVDDADFEFHMNWKSQWRNVDALQISSSSFGRDGERTVKTMVQVTMRRRFVKIALMHVT